MCEYHPHFMGKYEEVDIRAFISASWFEQAFDTVEWSVIDQACIKWIKYFYTDIPSPVINNANLSYVFFLEGVRQLIIYLLTFSSLCWNIWVQPIEWFSGIWCNNTWIWISA